MRRGRIITTRSCPITRRSSPPPSGGVSRSARSVPGWAEALAEAWARRYPGPAAESRPEDWGPSPAAGERGFPAAREAACREKGAAAAFQSLLAIQRTPLVRVAEPGTPVIGRELLGPRAWRNW